MMVRGNKERTTVNFDANVYQRILGLRAEPEYARMSISAIVNRLLEKALNDKRGERSEA